MEPNNDPACHGCRFWLSESGEMGDCRRYAPRPVLDGHMVMIKPPPSEGDEDTSGEAVWPITFASDFCGEFKERPALFRPSWVPT